MNNSTQISFPKFSRDHHVLILGHGFVGGRFTEHLARRGMAYKVLRRSTVDYTLPGRLEAFLRIHRPSFVINAAGFTGRPNIDACEDARAETLLGNAVLPSIIREACENTTTPWGHVSTGCIYTGRRPDGTAFTENDPPNFSFRQDNCSFYSGTKALGEECLIGASQCFTWRLRLPFDHRDSGKNYLSKLVRYNRFLDVENSISQLDDFVDAALRTWLQKAPFGVYNIVNPGTVTTREVVERLQAYGLIQRPISYFESEDEFLQTAARTPRSNCALSARKLIDAGIPIRPVSEAIEDTIMRWQPDAASMPRHPARPAMAAAQPPLAMTA